MKTYYVHSISGDRIDGTHYSINYVESVEENEALIAKSDTKTEFYTEKHRYFFQGTKKACEEMAEVNNVGLAKNGNYGAADWGKIRIDGKEYSTEYDYKNGTKLVYSVGRPFFGVTVDLKTGEVIEKEHLNDEVEKARKLIEEHDKLMNALTNKKEEEAV